MHVVCCLQIDRCLGTLVQLVRNIRHEDVHVLLRDWVEGAGEARANLDLAQAGAPGMSSGSAEGSLRQGPLARSVA